MRLLLQKRAIFQFLIVLFSLLFAGFLLVSRHQYSTNFQVKSIYSLVARIACWYNVFPCNVTTCFVDMNFQLDCIVTAAGRTLAWPRLAREFEPMVFL